MKGTSELIEILTQTPTTLRSLLGNLSEPWVIQKGREGGWSAIEVVAHLIHGEHTDWIVRARLILAQGDQRTFTPFEREGFTRDFRDQGLTSLLEQFKDMRDANLNELKSMELDDAKLGLTGVHPELGPCTLLNLLATWAAHDLGHIAQITTSVARRTKTAVGPWDNPNYLGVLK